MDMQQQHEQAGDDVATGLPRRVIPQRSTRWAARTADALAALRLTPNSISVLSAVIVLVAAALLVASGLVEGAARVGCLVTVALLLPLRLLCNMLDGMLAVEHGLHTPTGDLFNEVPDRIADLVVLAGAGYATAGLWVVAGQDIGVGVGWVAAALAVLTAYIRTLGAANGVGNFFAGPMAKPTRMWVVAAACLLATLEPLAGLPRGSVLGAALVLVAAGAFVTVIVRLRLIARALRRREAVA